MQKERNIWKLQFHLRYPLQILVFLVMLNVKNLAICPVTLSKRIFTIFIRWPVECLLLPDLGAASYDLI